LNSPLANIFRLALLALVALPARCLFAQPPQWVLMTAAFDRQQITVSQIDPVDLIFTEHGKPMTLGLDQVLRLDRQDISTTPSGPWQLRLVDGDRIFGQAGDLQNDLLMWTNPMLAELKFPLDQVQAMVRSGDVPGDTRKEDRIVLANHDQVSGVVSGIQDGKVSIQAHSQTTAVPLSSTDAILFASIPAARKLPTEAYRILLRDQSRVTVQSLSLKSDRLVAQFPGSGEERSVNFDDVMSIEHVNGPVSWLSDRSPITSEQAAFASDLSYPPQMDRNVFGGPLRFESETFAKGIGVHANSKLTFSLDGSYRLFRTRYAIDTTGDCGKANVIVRILLDGKPVHVREHLKAYQMSPVVSLDLGNSKTLTLEVTAGAAADTQDRLNWLEAALVRQATTANRPDGLSPTTGTTIPS
jgi:hypothetical protein